MIGLSALRCLVARVLESVLLIDRCQYLLEELPENSRVELHPLFDAELSPRNYAIVALKGRASAFDKISESV